MRIALMPSAYAPHVGGVEVLTNHLAHHLERRGHAVEVWTARSPGDGLSEDEVIEGIRVRRFLFALPRAHPMTLLEFPRPALATFGALRTAAREFGPDVLHVQCFSGNGAYAAVLGRIGRLPIVVTLQGETLMDDNEIYERSASLRMALRFGLRQAAVVTACSAYVLDDARARFGLRRSKGEVVFNGVDIDEIEIAPFNLPFRRYVLGVGRVVWKKGFDLLLEAFSEAAVGSPDVGLVIGGSGPATAELEGIAASLGLQDRFHLTGRLDRRQLASVIAGAEILVMPSRVEPFGIVVLEGWRAGVPVIATLRGGCPEFIEDGVSGLLVDPLDPKALSSAVASLLGSPPLRERLAAGGRRAVGAFLWERKAETYEGLYVAATAMRAKGPSWSRGGLRR